MISGYKQIITICKEYVMMRNWDDKKKKKTGYQWNSDKRKKGRMKRCLEQEI